MSFFTRRGGGCKFQVVNIEKKLIPPLEPLENKVIPPNKNINDAVALGTWLEYSLKFLMVFYSYFYLGKRTTCPTNKTGPQDTKLVYLPISHNTPESHSITCCKCVVHACLQDLVSTRRNVIPPSGQRKKL